MLASTVSVFFVQAANFNFYLRRKGDVALALAAHRCGRDSYHRRKIETDGVLLLDIFRLLKKLHVLVQLGIRLIKAFCKLV